MQSTRFSFYTRLLLCLLFGVSLISGSFSPARAQSVRGRQALEREKKENLEKMIQLRNILRETASQKEASLGQLKALNQQIQAQSKQINLLGEDVRLIETEVGQLRKTSQQLTADLKKLKAEYAQMIYTADRRRQQVSPLGFLFAADNFNQLIARYRYLKQYSDARQSQKRQMEAVQNQLRDKQIATERKRKQQQGTLVAKVNETRKLETLQQDQNKVVQELSQKETELRNELAESRRSVARLESMITRLIEREARERAERERAERARLAKVEADRKAAAEKRRTDALAAAAAAEKVGKPAPVPIPEPEPIKPEVVKADERNNNNLSDAEEALASSFTASRAHLPWPVQHGFISEQFGVHPHPVLKGLKVSNPGIDIQTNAGEPVRAVYDGIVRDVQYMQGSNNVVAIQHGDYFTVYANLRSVSVRAGQKVKAREPIGVVSTSANGVSELQFQIWKEFTKLNPATWLVGR